MKPAARLGMHSNITTVISRSERGRGCAPHEWARVGPAGPARSAA